MVSVLAIATKVRAFKLGPMLWIFKGDKHVFLQSEVKPKAPCSKILQHVKIICKCVQKYFIRINLLFPPPVHPACY
jgi:hypothetical protein